MAGLQQEIERAEARGDKKVKGFSGNIRSLENTGLEKGDTFTFPEKYDVYEQKIGENTTQYVFVDLGNGNVKPFYPSTFTKVRTVYNEDGISTGVRKYTMGTAADLFRANGSVEKGMDALRGKKVVVSDLEMVRTLRFGTQSLMNAQIPTIDLVD